VSSAVEQLEKAHVELHRRNETLQQKTRTIYLIDKVLTLDAATDDPRQLRRRSSFARRRRHARPALLADAAHAGWRVAVHRGGARRRAGVSEGRACAIGQGIAGRVAARASRCLFAT
jgi:hypothetical protein